MYRTLLVTAFLLTPLAMASQAAAQTFEQKFGHLINLDDPDNYAEQPRPDYIRRDNTTDNPVTDLGATLGRILFHDKKLSANRSISCSSCHSQILAFSDDATTSTGENGLTGRHSMRLINSRFSDERRFFWDERATSLEDQTTQPIQDHIEMGFSGEDGQPGIGVLLERLSTYPYYTELFTLVYGDSAITEERLQLALAQFIRSIQSFDSRYDQGRSQVANDGAPFPNFNAEENQGKQLFLTPPQFAGATRVGGGFGCAGCHRPPEFDIAPNSQNNGVIGVAGAAGTDLTNTRSPTLRDLFQPFDGQLNGPLMHNGSMTSFTQVMNHYNSPPLNPNLDGRLRRPRNTRMNLNMTPAEINAVTAFVRTLSGEDVYTNEKWSDPFLEPPSLAIDEVVIEEPSSGRSVVTRLMFVFNREVELDDDWLTLENLTTGESVVSTQTTMVMDDGRSYVNVTFGEGPSVQVRDTDNSLADGEYELRVHAELVSVVGSEETLPEDFDLTGVTDGMFRLYGDLTGDGQVAVDDFIVFRQTFGSTQGDADYFYEADFDGNGVVDVTDFIAFRNQFGFGY